MGELVSRIKSRMLVRLAVRGRGVTVGRDLHVGPGSIVWAPRSLVLGNDVYIGKHVTIEVDGEIGDGVMIANSVGLIGRRDHDHLQVGSTIRAARWVGDHPDALSDRLVVGSDVWIGYGAVVLSGLTIGDSSIVAAGSVVTSDVPPNAIVAGVPARVVAHRFQATELHDHWTRLASNGIRLNSWPTEDR